eukprot:gb/GEZN01006035.1/.p1 GENE.gb/GEZN01006035.1/~~gb/GEZN01006035.1/.p1  ORF type:complete len:532 (-),score=79.37 gb/GEZN01006035.1/:92-1687(-)
MAASAGQRSPKPSAKLREIQEDKEAAERNDDSCGYCCILRSQTEDKKLRRCSACRQISYCCVPHQKIHWKLHKLYCKVWKKQKQEQQEQEQQPNPSSSSPSSSSSSSSAVSIPAALSPPSSPQRVVICGAGVTGCCAAYYLTLRGFKPIIVERTSVAAAASGKAGGFLAENWCDNKPRQELMRESWKLHFQLASLLDGKKNYGFRPMNTIGIAMPEIEAQPRPDAKLIIIPPGKPHGNWINGKVYYKRDMGTPETTAQVHPREFTEHMLRCAQERGAELRIGEVQDIICSEDRDALPKRKVTGVKVNGEILDADKVLIAMGPWSGQAQKWFGPTFPEVVGQKCHSIIIQPKKKDAEKVSATSVFLDFDGRNFEPPSNIHPTYEFYPRTHMAEPEVYLHGMDERWRVPEEPSAAEVEATPGSCERLHKVACHVSEPLRKGKLTTKQACYMPVVADGEPILGPVPGVSGAFVATANAEWGITLGPATGLACSQLIADGACCYNLSQFAATRFPVGMKMPNHLVSTKPPKGPPR